MFWSDIFLSLREALAIKQSQSGYNNLLYPKKNAYGPIANPTRNSQSYINGQRYESLDPRVADMRDKAKE